MCELLYFYFNVFIHFYTRLIKYICVGKKKELDKVLIMQLAYPLKMQQDAVLSHSCSHCDHSKGL